MHQDSHQQQRQEFLHPHHQDDQQSQNPPWVDEFIEFSAARRGAHRSTVSDSLVEGGSIPVLREHVNVTEIDKNNSEVEFDKFDEEQFMSMFSKEFGRSTSDPSSTSDHNSTNDSQKRHSTTRKEKGLRRRERVEDGEKAEEVESLRKFDKDKGEVKHQGGNVATSDGTMIGCVDQKEQQSTIDPKRVRRILANRQSAQRSRVRKLQYISELERSVTTLQSEVSALSPRVAFLGHQRIILTYDNNSLKAKIAAFAQDKIFKDAHQEAMKREIERLRQVYYQQNLDKETDSAIPPSTSSSIPLTAQPSPLDPTVNKNEHLIG